jgi:hypothetical protein
VGVTACYFKKVKPWLVLVKKMSGPSLNYSLLDFEHFALAWNRYNRPQIDAIMCYCNNMRLVERCSKLSSSNRVHNIFFVCGCKCLAIAT